MHFGPVIKQTPLRKWPAVWTKMCDIYPSIVNAKIWKFNSVSNNKGMIKLVILTYVVKYYA